MGCWYSTCFMSHLPLMPGDDIRIIVLAPTYPKEFDGLTCHSDERYTPIGFPICAEYDDDGRFRNIREINDYTERYLREFTTVYTKVCDDAYAEYEWNSLEDFLRDVIDGYIYVDNRGEKMPLKHVMIHGKLYHMLIEDMRRRVPSNQEQTFGDSLDQKIRNTMHWLTEGKTLGARLIESMRNAEHLEDLDESDFDMFGRSFSDKVKVNLTAKWKTLDIMAKFFVETNDYRILDDILEYILWCSVMNFSRHGYFCLPGAGSQSQEMKLQKIIAEFILAKYKEKEGSKRVEEIPCLY